VYTYHSAIEAVEQVVEMLLPLMAATVVVPAVIGKAVAQLSCADAEKPDKANSNRPTFLKMPSLDSIF
jgi:hypothetical protein